MVLKVSEHQYHFQTKCCHYRLCCQRYCCRFVWRSSCNFLPLLWPCEHPLSQRSRHAFGTILVQSLHPSPRCRQLFLSSSSRHWVISILMCIGFGWISYSFKIITILETFVDSQTIVAQTNTHNLLREKVKLTAYFLKSSKAPASFSARHFECPM